MSKKGDDRHYHLTRRMGKSLEAIEKVVDRILCQGIWTKDDANLLIRYVEVIQKGEEINALLKIGEKKQ